MKNEYYDKIIDAAIDTYPLVELPDGFLEKVIATADGEKKTPFRLGFLEVAIPLFFMFFITMLSGITLWLLLNIDPLVLLKIKFLLMSACNGVSQDMLMSVLALGILVMSVGSAAITGFVMYLNRPVVSVRI
jgi:hypothetical protein